MVIYGGHRGHVTKTIFTKFMFSYSQGGYILIFALIGLVVSEKKMFKYKGHVYVYSHRAREDNPLGYLFVQKYKSFLLDFIFVQVFLI